MRDYDDCRPYLDHLYAEHRRLHELLRHLRNSNSGNEGASKEPADNLPQMLTDLRGELSHHFAEEEDGGCLEEAVSRCPTLSAETNRIETEHPQLLDELDQLIALASKLKQTAQNNVIVQQALDVFADRIRAHEHAESEVLMRAFGSGVAVYENGCAPAKSNDRN